MTHKLGQQAGPEKFGTESKKKQMKSVPKGIDPAYPNKNFVKACYANKGDMDGYYDHLYGPIGSSYSSGERVRKASGYGHSIGQRAGKLRTSGSPRAHRIGKR